jgi:drug/metabolite transporter (DMT)-like permease
VDPLALLLIVAAAVAHAGWNLFAKKAGGGGAPFVWCVTVASTLLYAPLVAGYLLSAQPRLTWLLVGTVVVSAALRLGYFLILQRGYAVGDLTVVYPLARGTGPLLAVILAVILLGEHPPALVLFGGLLVVAGVLVVGSAGVTAPARAAAADPTEADTPPAPLTTAVDIATETAAETAAVAVRPEPALAVATLHVPALRVGWKPDGGRGLVCGWECAPAGGGAAVLAAPAAVPTIRLDKQLVLTKAIALAPALDERIGGSAEPAGRWRWMSTHSVKAGAGYGLLTGGAIAGYTLWDATAVTTFAVAPLLLEWGCNVGRSVMLAPYAAVRFARVRRTWQAHRREILAVGVLSPLAYVCVLLALTRAPVSVVAPARELSIVIAGLFGWLLLREPNPVVRLAGACVVLTGVVALAVG